MLQLDSPKDYIICSGVSIRLVEIVEYIFEKLNISKKLIVTNKNLMRPNEIKNIFGDNTKAKTDLEWDYDISFFEVLDILIDNEINLIK